MGTMAHAITMATDPAPPSLPAIFLCLSLSLYALSVSALSLCLSLSLSRHEVHEGCLSVRSVRPARPSLRLHARAYVIPLFCHRASLHRLFSVSPAPRIDPVNASPPGPLKIARIRNNLVFELTMEESLFLIRTRNPLYDRSRLSVPLL